MPLRGQIKFNALPSALKKNCTNEQDKQQQIGECSSEVHDFAARRNPFDDAEVADDPGQEQA